MELRHLRYFLTVAQESNFTRAAARLGLQQPPLSQQIRDLERELGFPLFRRLPRGVELTAAGQAFVDEAQAIVASVDRAAAKARRAHEGAAGALTLGFTSSAVTHRIAPAVIRRFREARPEIALTLSEGNAATLTEAIAAGTLDAALIRRPVSKQSGLRYDLVAREKLLVAIPADHPLARRARRDGRRIRLTELAAEAFILTRRPGAPGLYGDLIEACQRLGFAPRVIAEVEQMLTDILLVAAGVGVSVVPESMGDIHDDRIVYCVATDAPQLEAPLNLVTRLDARNPAVEALRQVARSAGRGLRTPRAQGRRIAV